MASAAGRPEGKGAEAARTYVAAGGDPEQACSEHNRIVAATIRGHTDWFWRPVRARIERENRAWKARGIWPPPQDHTR